MLRRFRRSMPKQGTEMNEIETNELGAAQSEEGAANDAAAAETGTVPEAGAATAGPQAVESAVEDSVPRAQYDQLKTERDQLLDRLARMQAEFENARRRAEREKSEYRDYAAGSVVEQFLPVLDNFELALKATGTTEQLRSGVELIVKQMEEILRQMNVTAVPAVGEEFNPHQHEALGSVERLDLPDQHVAEEIRRGYKIREKLLRPALVRVVSNPKQTVE
jgi:molecular chaperone GrpE